MAGFVGAFHSNSMEVGVVVALVTGMLLGVLMGWVCVDVGADQTVAGLALNLAMLGMTEFVFKKSFTFTYGTSVTVPGFENIYVPFLSDIPIVGPIFFQQGILVYIAILLFPVFWFLLNKTGLGLMIRACGENPEAADTAGTDVRRIRYMCMIVAGALASLGGSFLSLAIVGTFTVNMTAGRGFIALAIVMFGRQDPLRVLGGGFMFGALDALQLRVQILARYIPWQLIAMLPYALTVVVLTVFVGRGIKLPAALGIHYEKEKLQVE